MISKALQNGLENNGLKERECEKSCFASVKHERSIKNRSFVFFMVMVNVGFVWAGPSSCRTEINKDVTSSSAHLSTFYVFRLDSFYYVPIFFSCKIKEYKLKNLYLNERRDDESERY